MRLVPLLALALLLAACGERASAVDPATTGNPLVGRTFLSTTVTENGKPRPLIDRTRVRLRFMDDGRLIADAGCSSMQAPVSLEGGQLRLDDLSATGVGCDPALHEQDSWLSRILTDKPSWRLDGDNLVLSSNGTEIVLLDRAVAEPALPLEGTRWAVDTIIDGQTAAAPPADQVATLTFDKGSVGVSTPCNSGSAEYQVSGTTIRFGRAVSTLKACSGDLMTLERAIFDVLRDEATFEIDSNHLTLTHSSGKGLQLRGER